MLFETPEDTFNAYLRFLKKREYKKAYRCLEKMLHRFPDDCELLESMVDLCLHEWRRPEMAKQWLVRLAGFRTYWLDYVVLSGLELDNADFVKAREHLTAARAAYKKSPLQKTRKEADRIFSNLEDRIKYGERVKAIREQKPPAKAAAVGQSAAPVAGHISKIRKSERKDAEQDAGKNSVKLTIRSMTVNGMPVALPQEKKMRAEETTPAYVPPPQPQIPSYRIHVKVEPYREDAVAPLMGERSSLEECVMLIDYARLSVQGVFDDLLCLNALSGVEKYWYQIETVRKVLKNFHGRVLLADEVGLGKTVEAGMLIKEYVMRGMVNNVLVLTPAPLVSQWKEEMRAKFGMEFLATDDPEFAEDAEQFWRRRFIISSINTAKGVKNAPFVCEEHYDLVVVDEAHHLRNRTTLGWKLVNQIKKKFIFLLTATPVQNDLIELFNLITLLKPGQFKTEKMFKQEYVKKGDLKAPADKEKLRGLLRDVMIRNTRSAIDLKLPRRFASTLRLAPLPIEKEIYRLLSDFLRGRTHKRNAVNLLLREAGSSPFALKKTLLKMSQGDGVKDIINAMDSLTEISKGKAVMEIIRKNPSEKKIVFTQFTGSIDYLSSLMSREGVHHVRFSGEMTSREKDAAIAEFKESAAVLLSTESGGEGRNLQFCNTIINFDIPWNPMRIEQRIGRLHRIGQNRDVFIFNLSVRDTVEDFILEILDNKINMFEMVIGEIEPILGYIGEDADFEEIILDLWLGAADDQGVREGFERLGDDMAKAKKEYLKAREMDAGIFGEDFEV
jgi:SNF2 family DNA or RNA helicase